MQLPTEVQLTECQTGAIERASIVTLDRETAKTKIDAAWWTHRAEFLSDPENEPDHHWRWREITSIYQNKPDYRAVCLRTLDGEAQAAMLLQFEAASNFAKGQRAIFIDRLATAPSNRANLAVFPRFRGAGTALMIYALAYSHSLGYDGRVNLCVTGSESFYRGFGFIPTGVQRDDETLFELPAATAIQRLRQEGLIDE